MRAKSLHQTTQSPNGATLFQNGASVSCMYGRAYNIYGADLIRNITSDFENDRALLKRHMRQLQSRLSNAESHIQQMQSIKLPRLRLVRMSHEKKLRLSKERRRFLRGKIIQVCHRSRLDVKL